jgi:type I restriction enzyme S subunit
MASALEYIAKWQMQDSMDWLVKTFKYIGVEELELLATVDMAMCDLVHAGIEVSVDSIKQLIRSNEEWKAKLKKVTFSDDAIARAIEKCRELFGY